MGAAQFSEWTDNTDGIANIVSVHNAVGQSIAGTPYSVHHGSANTLYMPSWMIRELELDNDNCGIERVTPGPCTGLVLQPHTSEHITAEDPQELLRDAFENYSCLTPGTTIPLWIGTQQITVTIVQLTPTPNTTLCIRNCELTLELLRPLDMPEPVAVPVVPVIPVAGAGAPISVVATVPAPIDIAARRALMAAAARSRMGGHKI